MNQTQQPNKVFEEMITKLCQSETAAATPAIRAIINLGEALNQVSKSFSSKCGDSEKLIEALLQMMHPLKTNDQNFQDFTSILEKHRHLRGQRIFDKNQPSPTLAPPVLRRTVSSNT